MAVKHIFGSHREQNRLVEGTLCRITGCSYVYDFEDLKLKQMLKDANVEVTFDYDDPNPTFLSEQDHDTFLNLAMIRYREEKQMQKAA